MNGFNKGLFNLQIVLVPVKKKDGMTRGVSDLRLLNDVTFKDAYPHANIQENLQKLKGAKIFTSINACGAYHCIQIEEGSRNIWHSSALLEPSGTYRCLLACLTQAVSTAGCWI